MERSAVQRVFPTVVHSSINHSIMRHFIFFRRIVPSYVFRYIVSIERVRVHSKYHLHEIICSWGYLFHAIPCITTGYLCILSFLFYIVWESPNLYSHTLDTYTLLVFLFGSIDENLSKMTVWGRGTCLNFGGLNFFFFFSPFSFLL